MCSFRSLEVERCTRNSPTIRDLAGYANKTSGETEIEIAVDFHRGVSKAIRYARVTSGLVVSVNGSRLTNFAVAERIETYLPWLSNMEQRRATFVWLKDWSDCDRGLDEHFSTIRKRTC